MIDRRKNSLMMFDFGAVSQLEVKKFIAEFDLEKIKKLRNQAFFVCNKQEQKDFVMKNFVVG